MKKLYYLIVLTLILGLVLTGCFLSNVGQVPTTGQSGISYLTKGIPGDPDVFTLYAGQHIDVGTVEVWNDAGNLYVQYVVDGPWEMTGSHLYVGKTDPANFPSTPGQFPYSPGMEKSPSLNALYDSTTMTYTIPLDQIYKYVFVGKGQGKGLNAVEGTADGVEDEEEIFIAAHAEVQREYFETVWEIGDVEVVNIGTSWLENYADEFNWGDPAGPITMGPSLVDEKPLYANPFIVGTNNDNEFPYNSNASKEYNYAPNFDVQWNGSLPFGGLLTISWTPGASGTEEKVVSGDGISSPAIFTATGGNIPSMGWFMDKYPLVEHSVAVGPLPDETHTINFQHTKGNGSFWDWIRLKEQCIQEETAWAEGDSQVFGKNWATYFTYVVELPPVCSLSITGNTKDISWGFRNMDFDLFPNDMPITFTGTVNASGLQDNGAVFIGLLDKKYVDEVSSGWMGGAYAYFGRRGNNLAIGPTDGNLGGEIVQVFKTFTDYFSSPTDIYFTMVLHANLISITVNGDVYTDSYGEIKDLNSKDAYAWDEFANGAYIGIDSWPYGASGINDVAYDVIVDWCE